MPKFYLEFQMDITDIMLPKQQNQHEQQQQQQAFGGVQPTIVIESALSTTSSAQRASIGNQEYSISDSITYPQLAHKLSNITDESAMDMAPIDESNSILT